MGKSPHQMAARLAKMQRIHGMSPDAKERMDAASEKAENWWAICRVCGEKVVGSLETLQTHAAKHDNGK